MYQCRNFITTNSKNICKLNCNNGGTTGKFIQPSRGAADKVAFKRPNMKELPVPSGSWSAKYSSQNKKNNAILLIGASTLGLTIGYMTQSKYFANVRGPDIEAFKKLSENNVSSEEGKETAIVKPSAATKSAAVSVKETSSDSSKSEHGKTTEHLVIISEIKSDVGGPSTSIRKKGSYVPS